MSKKISIDLPRQEDGSMIHLKIVHTSRNVLDSRNLCDMCGEQPNCEHSQYLELLQHLWEHLFLLMLVSMDDLHLSKHYLKNTHITTKNIDSIRENKQRWSIPHVKSVMLYLMLCKTWGDGSDASGEKNSRQGENLNIISTQHKTNLI